MQALLSPASLIAHNAGMEGAVVVEKILESPWEIGYNAMEDRYEDLMSTGRCSTRRNKTSKSCMILFVVVTASARLNISCPALLWFTCIA